MNTDFSSVLSEIIQLNPIKLVISNPRNKSSVNYNKIVIIKKIISKKEMYQAEQYTKTQVFHTNIDVPALGDFVTDVFGSYKQINVFSESMDLEVKVNKDGGCYVSKKPHNITKIKPVENNRSKNYLLNEGMDIPVFVELGIFTGELKIVNSMYDKFKQINRFTEFVDDALKNFSKDEINIIDFGCGKSYLTFIIYYYLTEIKRIKANIIGLDLKADVIKKCNSLANQFEYTGLRFEIGDINGFKAPFDVDMVVTLHACDTATDYALYNAVCWGASVILSVPCCQHEVNKQIKSDKLKALTKYGIVKERMSALITDSIRGCMLEYAGYKTELIEFIDIEHSPKNILIRAIRRNISKEKKEDSYSQAKALAEEFSIEQKLMKLMEKEL